MKKIKKLMSLLCAVLICSGIGLTASAANAWGDNIVNDHFSIKGDVNTDNSLDVRDLVRLKKQLAGVEVEINSDMADIDDSGAIDTTDLASLRKMLLGIEL